jgi:hypothetical protein
MRFDDLLVKVVIVVDVASVALAATAILAEPPLAALTQNWHFGNEIHAASLTFLGSVVYGAVLILGLRVAKVGLGRRTARTGSREPSPNNAPASSRIEPSVGPL